MDLLCQLNLINCNCIQEGIFVFDVRKCTFRRFEVLQEGANDKRVYILLNRNPTHRRNLDTRKTSSEG